MAAFSIELETLQGIMAALQISSLRDCTAKVEFLKYWSE